jgi:hypothetical protein
MTRFRIAGGARLVALALLLLCIRGAVAEPLPCASPETNPLMSPAMAAESLGSFQAGTQHLPPLTLPRQLISTWDLDVTLSPHPVAVAEEGALTALAEEAKEGGFSRIACAEVAELKGTILCLFNDIIVGNLALFRAVSWIDGSVAGPRRQFVRRYAEYSDLTKPPFRFVDGMDLRWQDLKAYYEAATAACPVDRTACLNRYEEQIFEKLLFPLARERPELVLLGAGYGRRWIISHEILHAQYFLIAKYRAIVDCYFDRVLSRAARSEVGADLKSAYDVTNDFLVRNEFQAYLLQDAGTSHLPRMRTSDREELLHILHVGGDFPVMLHPR